VPASIAGEEPLSLKFVALMKRGSDDIAVGSNSVIVPEVYVVSSGYVIKVLGP
jgi:hypothetical protein